MNTPSSDSFPDIATLQGGERRVSLRHASDEEALCHLGGASRHECRHAWVLDVCTNGIGLRLVGDIRPGTRVVLEFPETSGATRRTLRARVAHCTYLDDGTSQVGCRFEAPLADHEVLAIARD